MSAWWEIAKKEAKGREGNEKGCGIVCDGVPEWDKLLREYLK